MEGAMGKAMLWSKSVPQAELDQRAHEARLRFERMERQFLPRAAVARSPLRLLYLCSVGIFANASRESGPKGPLSHRRPSRTDIWVEECGSFYRESDLVLCRPSG
jgi:hypothetical protein